MSFYSSITIGVILFPLILTFDKKVHFYTHLKSVFISILTVGLVYIVWDALVTKAGHWSFADHHVFPLRLFGLPLEEISFFIAVPYACLFTYEVIREYFKEKILSFPTWLGRFLVVLLAVGGILGASGGYSRLTLVSVLLFLYLTESLKPILLRERSFWITTLICFGLFFLVNTLLTGRPVVLYNREEIWNIRIGSIPLEDFFYQFGYIGSSILVYRIADDKMHQREN